MSGARGVAEAHSIHAKEGIPVNLSTLSIRELRQLCLGVGGEMSISDSRDDHTSF